MKASYGSTDMQLNELGYELINNFISTEVACAIISETDSALASNKTGGMRHAEKKFASVSALAASNSIIAQAEQYLTGRARLVRAILFDKSPENNWLVTWHQDKTVAVSRRFEAEGWGPWSIKEGVHHVQPPVKVLEDMIAFRIHLDESNSQNGCLRIIPGSHSEGVLSQEQIHNITKNHHSVSVEAPALSALVMRPHLLHASSKGAQPSRRRVLHLEYSSYQLSNGAKWA